MIKLTRKFDGKPILVNPEQITCVAWGADEDDTLNLYVTLSATQYYIVSETFEEVEKLLSCWSKNERRLTSKAMYDTPIANRP